METDLGQVTLAAMLILIGCGLLYVALESLLRGWKNARPPMLGEMLARQGVDFADAVRPGQESQCALAARRCANCGAQEECAKWLDAGGREGYDEFCPNAGFIRQAARS